MVGLICSIRGGLAEMKGCLDRVLNLGIEDILLRIGEVGKPKIMKGRRYEYG